MRNRPRAVNQLSVRVPTEQLDRLVNMVGELVGQELISLAITASVGKE